MDASLDNVKRVSICSEREAVRKGHSIQKDLAFAIRREAIDRAGWPACCRIARIRNIESPFVVEHQEIRPSEFAAAARIGKDMHRAIGRDAQDLARISMARVQIAVTIKRQAPREPTGICKDLYRIAVWRNATNGSRARLPVAP